MHKSFINLVSFGFQWIQHSHFFPIFPSEGLKYSDQDLVQKFDSQGGGKNILITGSL